MNSYYDKFNITTEEHIERYDLYFKWQQCRVQKNYVEADKFRALYAEWDVGLGHPTTWIPIFESTAHYAKRIKKHLSD